MFQNWLYFREGLSFSRNGGGGGGGGGGGNCPLAYDTHLKIPRLNLSEIKENNNKISRSRS